MSKNDRDHAMDSFLKERLDTEVPPEVDARLRQHLAAFRERMESRESTRERWRRILLVPRWRVAVRYAIPAAVLLLAALMFWPRPGVKKGPLAFADVLEQLREFRPYAWTSTILYEGEVVRSKRIMRPSPTRAREIWPDGRIIVRDQGQRPTRTLILYPDEKFAVEEIHTNMGPFVGGDVLTRVSQLREVGADLGMKTVDGRVAQGFHVHEDLHANDYTLWVDPETGLPVRIEIVQGKLGRTMITNEFDFDVDFDESLFSTTAPEGYTVEKVVSDAVNPTEEHLVEGLRIAATLQDGSFPSVTDFRELQYGLDRYVQRIGSSASEEEIESLHRSVRLAMQYIEVLNVVCKVNELRYVGDGVALGDAESPVIWWLFKALDTYRVVYGDLSVRDVPPEDLPDFSADQYSDLLAEADGDFFPYVCTYTVKDEGKPDETWCLMRRSPWRRREIMPDGTISVVDLSGRPIKTLKLIPDEKRAVETTLIDRGNAQDPDMLQMAKDAHGGSGENLGLRVVEGREAQGYRTSSPAGNDITYWMDEETDLPLRIEIVHAGTGRQIIMSEFEWDVELDQSLFSTTAPEGYEVERVEK